MGLFRVTGVMTLVFSRAEHLSVQEDGEEWKKALFSLRSYP